MTLAASAPGVAEAKLWGRRFWAIGDAAWSIGAITEEMVQEYLEHHRHPSNKETDNFILEEYDLQTCSNHSALLVQSGLISGSSI